MLGPALFTRSPLLHLHHLKKKYDTGVLHPDSSGYRQLCSTVTFENQKIETNSKWAGAVLCKHARLDSSKCVCM